MIEIVGLDKALPPSVLDQLSPEMMAVILRRVALGVRDEWIRLASTKLSGRALDYIAGLQEVEMRGTNLAVIALEGAWPNAIEHGQESYDMRDTLLGPDVPVATEGGRGKRRSKKGHYYRAIPFRHDVGTRGSKFATAYKGHDAVKDVEALGRSVYKEARKLAPTVTQAYGGTVKRGGALPPGLAPRLQPHHKTDIFAGMIRAEKAYESATQSTYMTFRTISEAVQEGWISPAREGTNLIDPVRKYAETVLPQAVNAFLREGGSQ